jgi:hypothetical protein
MAHPSPNKDRLRGGCRYGERSFEAVKSCIGREDLDAVIGDLNRRKELRATSNFTGVGGWELSLIMATLTLQRNAALRANVRIVAQHELMECARNVASSWEKSIDEATGPIRATLADDNSSCQFGCVVLSKLMVAADDLEAAILNPTLTLNSHALCYKHGRCPRPTHIDLDGPGSPCLNFSPEDQGRVDVERSGPPF